MKQRQLEFKGKGFKAARASFDSDAALQGLLDIARSYIPAAEVHVDATENRELWHRSRVRWVPGGGPKALEVYYHSFELLLPVLAHEVGHLETIPELGGIDYYSAGGVSQYKCEYFASSWALGYLRAAGMGLKELRAAQALLQGCLDNYRENTVIQQAEYPHAFISKAPRFVLNYQDSPAMKAGQIKGV